MAARAVVVLGTASLLAGFGGAAPGQELRLASVMPDGSQIHDQPWDAAISGDGNVVAFMVRSDAFSPNPTGAGHVLLADRTTGAIEDPSLDPSGAPLGNCYYPSLSWDGRYVAFGSNSVVYLRDRVAGTTTIASVSSSGVVGNGNSSFPFLSSDGRYVLFMSDASNLVAGDANGLHDVFLRDLVAGTTERVSVAVGGGDPDNYSYSQGVSDDGRYALIWSVATNLVASDTNGKPDLFVFDRVLGTTELVSVSTSGSKSNGSAFLGCAINGDGSLVVFDSDATNLVPGDTNGKYDIFLRDRNAGTTTRVSVTPSGGQPNGDCWDPAISSDGSVIAYESRAKNLSPLDPNGHSDVYLLDRPSGTTTLVSCASDGTVSDQECYRACLAETGLVVAFLGGATNLDPADANGFRDAFASDFTNCPISSWSNYGAGWPGTLGVPTITLNADPDLGATIRCDIANSLGAATVGVLLLGESRASIPTSLGGTLLLLILDAPPLAIPAGGASLTEAIPYDSALAGLVLDVQVLELDPGASKGISFTAGLELVVGR